MDTEGGRTGGQILIEELLRHGVDTAFCVPGESYLAALDALHDVAERIQLIVCRHEAAAANMADAYGKLTGKPGICFVTRAPGATHAAVGVHTAFQDSTPVILFVGQVPRAHREREAFQEIDHRQVFAGLAKWTVEVADAVRLPELVRRAFQTATSGRPGPVVMALPEDVLRERATPPAVGPYRSVRPVPDAAGMTALRRVLDDAERPFVLVGGGGWNAQAAADIEQFARRFDLPVGASFRCQDYIDNHSEQYVGQVGLAVNPALAARVSEADVVIAVGDRLGEVTTQGYTVLTAPRSTQRLVHIYPDPDELGRVYEPDLAISAGGAEFAAVAATLAAPASVPWGAWRAAARQDYLTELAHMPVENGVDLGAVMAHLRKRLPPEAVIANGAGNYTVWVHRFHQYTRYRTQLAPVSGAMGYGVPAALAAKVVDRDRPVIAFAGDGCFLMAAQELATAVQYDLRVVVIVVNNGMYATIRMHQERDYPGRMVGTDLVNPDFAAYAAAFGAYGEVVEATEAFPAAFERALDARRPALLELRVDPDRLTPRATLSGLRATRRERAGEARESTGRVT